MNLKIVLFCVVEKSSNKKGFSLQWQYVLSSQHTHHNSLTALRRHIFFSKFVRFFYFFSVAAAKRIEEEKRFFNEPIIFYGKRV